MMGGWGYGPGMGGYYAAGGNGYWWAGILGMAMQLIFWVAIIAFGVYLFRRYGSRVGVNTSRNGSSALDILRERYARGEIERDEYERRKDDLLK